MRVGSPTLTASKMLTVPTTLTSAPRGGSARQNGTWSAARWMTFVMPLGVQDRLDRRQVGDVAGHEGDGRKLVRGHDQPQATRIAAHVEGDDLPPLADQAADRPGADAAERARDEEPLRSLAHALATATRSVRQTLRSRPIRSISTVTSSPSASRSGGSRKMPTPPGVPVAMTSPGSRLNDCEQ